MTYSNQLLMPSFKSGHKKSIDKLYALTKLVNLSETIQNETYDKTRPENRSISGMEDKM